MWPYPEIDQIGSTLLGSTLLWYSYHNLIASYSGSMLPLLITPHASYTSFLNIKVDISTALFEGQSMLK
jgi:hypothetical protein